LGLYVHIPFCASKCGYCDFYSVRAAPGTHEAYTNALIKQMREYSPAARGKLIDSVYIGGGTPTHIGIELLLSVIKNLKSNFEFSKSCEFTIETNPASIDLKGLKKLYKAGANRLSIGLQSANEAELRLLSRAHTFEEFSICYENAREAGFDNINIDVMYGIPGQSPKSFYETLKKAAQKKPAHISAYGLKIGPDTPFGKNLEKLQKILPSEESERAMYFMCIELLGKGGYNHYEISNFAKSGRECRHNLKYWKCEPYLGLGPGAHSYFSNTRFSFKKDIREYVKNFNYDKNKLQKLDIFDLEKYSLFDEHAEIKPNERLGEYVMLGFRLSSGIDKSSFAKLFGMDFEAMYLKKIAPFIESGHIVKTDAGYAFSAEGMFVSNHILAKIVDFE
jgi:oxygen-independent coproporphyrinogen-3 oxidase